MTTGVGRRPAALDGPLQLARFRRLGPWLLALLAYVPSLTAAPGRMPTDTKLYLYLDPGRLIADAPFSWDTRQFAGWVPHQTIAYLWPSGPWFWVFDKLGVPDWVAHRLWVGTILFLGALGIRWAAKILGLAPTGALVAAVVYQLSPYVLPYVSRTSVMLLPWAGVGWLVGLTVRACGRTRWRDAALFALVVLTVGAVNFTALAMVAPAPIIWLIHAVWQRTVTWRTALLTAMKLGGLSLLVSLWWIVMLMVQGEHGADVLAFSETLDAVSLTSVSTETLRGLGYWLFYVRDPYAFTTTASVDYMNSGRVIAAGFVLLLICLTGLAFTRWSQRRYAALLVLAGIVLAVGVHPIADPSPLMSPLADSGLGLALRSSTRALPVAMFGLALGAGSLVTALAATRIRWQWRSLAPVAVIGLAVVNLPALWTGGFVDPALERDQDPPDAWLRAAEALDRSSSEYRVLQLPGSEFGAFRWGYTVDPPLPGLTDKPLVTRDLLPLGSPAAMDLLYALDNRFQDGTIDTTAIAPLARLLAADTIWLSDDLAFDRFRTPRPEEIVALFGGSPDGLGTPVAYGTPAPNTPDIAMIDEDRLSDPTIGEPIAPVELVPVDDPQSVVRATDRVIVVVGSGDGVVDAAASGLIRGDEAIVYAADLGDRDRYPEGSVPLGTPVIITDSNRDRATQWRGSQDVSGMTETGGPEHDLTREDTGDQRLVVFPDETEADQTVARLDGDLVVRASGYGEPFAYRPEDRPAMAVDGDPSTAWVVADRAEPVGESIGLSSTDGALTLLQPQDPVANRMITEVSIVAGDGAPTVVALTAASLTDPGQAVEITAGVPVTVTITATAPRPGGTDIGPSAVGFAELGPVASEYVRVPTDTAGLIGDTTPLAIVLTRDRSDPTNRWRSDPERSIVRDISTPVDRSFDAVVTLRVDRRAADSAIADVAGLDDVALANRRLTGVLGARGVFAVDGDPQTGWTTPFGQAVGSSITVPIDASAPVAELTIRQPVDDLHSLITAVSVAVEGMVVELPVPPPDGDRSSRIEVPAGSLPAGGLVTVTITAVNPTTTTDRRFAEPVELPAEISELSSPSITTEPVRSAVPECRDDLLTVDGSAVGVAIDPEQLETLLAGDPVDVTTCDGLPIDLAAGTHRIESAIGEVGAIDVDRIELRSGIAADTLAADASSTPTSTGQATVSVERSRSERVATVGACPDGCWLVLGEGYNDAWWASIDGGADLGEPSPIAGGFNGWWLPAHDAAVTVTMSWTPQRNLNIALLAATFGILGCIALAAVDRRRRGEVAELGHPRLVLTPPVARRHSIIAAGLFVVVAGLAIAPVWTVFALPLAIAVVALRRTWLLGAASLAAAAFIALSVVRRELAERYFVNAGWPGHFEDLHRLGLFVVVAIAAGTLVSESDGRSAVGPASAVEPGADEP